METKLMTLKRHDGRWGASKVTLTCTVIGTAAAVVVALPTAISYGQKAVAPWTQLPEQIGALQRGQQNIERKVDKISDALQIKPELAETNFHLANQLTSQKHETH